MRAHLQHRHHERGVWLLAHRQKAELYVESGWAGYEVVAAGDGDSETEKKGKKIS